MAPIGPLRSSAPCLSPLSLGHLVRNTLIDLLTPVLLPLLHDKTPTLDHPTIHLRGCSLRVAERNWRKPREAPPEATARSWSQTPPAFSTPTDKHCTCPQSAPLPLNILSLGPASPPYGGRHLLFFLSQHFESIVNPAGF